MFFYSLKEGVFSAIVEHIIVSMGFFSYVFGFNQPKSIELTQWPLSENEMDHIIRLKTLSSITLKEKGIIIEAIKKARKGDGKISLPCMREELYKLEKSYQISAHDKEAVISAMREYFTNKYGKKV